MRRGEAGRMRGVVERSQRVVRADAGRARGLKAGMCCARRLRACERGVGIVRGTCESQGSGVLRVVCVWSGREAGAGLWLA